jgi:diguanylate cyclase (GGDEF)-like protein
MKIAHDVKLLRLIQVIPPFLVIVFACLAIFIVFNNNQANLERDLQSLRQDFAESRKKMVKAQVEQLIQQINFEKSNTESILKKDIKQHIYRAYAIAQNIYEQNKGKSEEEVTEIIKAALRDIRFNNGRGYYFIYKTTGESVMHPVLPNIEGTQKIDLQDSRGNYIVRDMGKWAKENGETYYTWWFVKPDNKHQEFKKIGFGKHFAPFDWFIGTGEYVFDVENDIKSSLTQRISNIRYGRNGYAFLMHYDGRVLVHIDKSFQGSNFNHNENNTITQTSRELISVAQNGGGFVNYQSQFMPSTGKPAQKTSFVQSIPQWQWIIGMGFYESEIDSQLEIRELEITDLNKQQLIELLSLSSIVIIFFITMSLLLARYLASRFTEYEETINKDFDELNRVKLASQHQALHDALTKLPNRLLLEKQLIDGISVSKAKNKMLAVIFADLDDFKKVNDLHGHSVGDGLLKQLGKLFQDVIGGKDTIARFGGDEFIICCPEIDDVNSAKRKVKAVLDIFKQQFEVEGKSIHSSCSIGVAMYPGDAEDPEELVSKADTALYRSKLVQKGKALFFNSEIDAQVKRDFMIETELRAALSNNEISVFYQPQISVKTGEITGVEALVRWQNETLGFVPPDEFIPIAESNGEIKHLGEFVLRKSMEQIKQFNLANDRRLNLSVNISPIQLLESGFVKRVLQISDDVGFPRNQITLEITENVLISDISLVQPILLDLKSSKFKLSLDDFGTGYSSLSYLSNLPMNEIKIDRSFIDKFLTNRQSESLVKTIIAIGDFCSLKVVAEGVETREQYERLVEYNCDLIQGYYFDKPLAFADFSNKYQICRVN